ncbi:mevalonate kinase [Streptomyces populi]|uniref:mevalonate kinase n=1 Tax=Streptomyces populi TaxID=2058924 RepID=UPI001F0B73F7|nr:mevalonate kinase [Streptomyces populi]
MEGAAGTAGAAKAPGAHPGGGAVGVGRAHAKAIVLGEHAVVYGAPALALPVPQLTVTARARRSSHPGDGDGLSFTVPGSAPRAVVDRACHGLRRLVGAFRERTGVHDGSPLEVCLDGGIPPGRGLGSSAANSRAVVLALAGLFGRELSEDMAFDLVQTAENVTHGRASGVDAMTVGASAPLLFRAGRARPLAVGCDGVFIVADSGTAGGTKEAGELLRAGFGRRAGAREAFVRRAARLAGRAARALAEGRDAELGTQLTHYHELMRDAGLSTGRIDALVHAALAAGSHGAKITGGGLGGCVLALASPRAAGRVTQRLLEAGAVGAWAVPLERGRRP